jgi:Tol biopolymer transport system component
MKDTKTGIVVLSVFLLLTGCAGIDTYYQVTSVPQESGIKFTKITGTEDLVDTTLDFAVSQDGEKIAFVSWKSGNGDIYVRKLTTGKTMLQRTFRNEREISPSFSPDGKYIAYSAYRDNNWHIYLVGAESGSAIRQITTTSPSNANNPTFSPDSQTIAFNSIEYTLQESGYNSEWVVSGNSIWTYDINTGALIQYTEGLQPQFTPDGRGFIFKRASKVGEGYYGLWMLDLESGAETNIISGEDFGIGHFDLSPDGKRIVFSTKKGTKKSSTERENQNIWTVDIDGGNLTQLTYHQSDDLNPHWAPDMSGIYFLSVRGEDDKETANIWKMSY